MSENGNKKAERANPAGRRVSGLRVQHTFAGQGVNFYGLSHFREICLWTRLFYLVSNTFSILFTISVSHQL